MNEKRLLKQIGEIDDKFVEEANTVHANKGSKAKNKMVWIKWMSIAASICIIVATGLAINGSGLLQGDKSKPDIKITPEIEDKWSGNKMDENWTENEDIEIGEVVSTGFGYYILCEDGKYKIVSEYEAKAEKMNVGEVVKRFIALNEIDDTQFEKVTMEETKAVTEEDNYILYNIYLTTTGDEFNDKIASGLVNTVQSYLEELSGNKYIKLYVNHQKYLIGGEMPERGYLYIDVDVTGEEGEAP